MKFIYNLSIFLALSISIPWLMSCSESQDEIRKMDWLIGSRSIEQNGFTTFEDWKKAENGELQGRSYILTDKDTQVVEFITIKVIDGVINYIPTVINQNVGNPPHFKMVSTDFEKLEFENKEHDFPTKICYYRDGENINAWIERDVEGTTKKIEFFMTNIK